VGPWHFRRGCDPVNPFVGPIVDVIGFPALGYSPDQWGEPATITARLSGGFADVDIESGSHAWRFSSVEAAVSFVTREFVVHVALLANVDAGLREPLLAAFEAALTEWSDAAGVRFDAPYVVVTARRR
jgi:hypothetical protein